MTVWTIWRADKCFDPFFRSWFFTDWKLQFSPPLIIIMSTTAQAINIYWTDTIVFTIFFLFYLEPGNTFHNFIFKPFYSRFRNAEIIEIFLFFERVTSTRAPTRMNCARKNVSVQLRNLLLSRDINFCSVTLTTNVHSRLLSVVGTFFLPYLVVDIPWKPLKYDWIRITASATLWYFNDLLLCYQKELTKSIETLLT